MKIEQELSCFTIATQEPDGTNENPNVSDYPTLMNGTANSCVVDADKLVTPLTTVSIHFDYPLMNPVTFDFNSPSGFTILDFYRCIYEGYSRIYEEERKTVASAEAGAGCGPYCIWGHDIDELGIDWVEEVEPGIFHLVICS